MEGAPVEGAPVEGAPVEGAAAPIGEGPESDYQLARALDLLRGLAMFSAKSSG